MQGTVRGLSFDSVPAVLLTLLSHAPSTRNMARARTPKHQQNLDVLVGSLTIGPFLTAHGIGHASRPRRSMLTR